MCECECDYCKDCEYNPPELDGDDINDFHRDDSIRYPYRRYEDE